MRKLLAILAEKPVLLLLSVGLVNLLVVLASPHWTVPPPLSSQRPKLLINLGLCTLPLVWTLILFTVGRGRVALAVGLIGLVPAILWLLYAIPPLAQSF